jgi:Zn-dependent protease with chaperone function
MPYCVKCGNRCQEGSSFCGGCGTAAKSAVSGEIPRPADAFSATLVSVGALRAPGESGALFTGLGLLVLSWLVLDVSTGFVPVVLVTLGLLAYVLYEQGALKGAGVAVGPGNFPEVAALADEAAAQLGIGKPNLFIKHSRELNAYAMGFVGWGCVVLHSEIVHATEHSPRELQFIIGHEFTHIKCAHVLWQTVAAKNPLLGRIPILKEVLPLFFGWWSRQAEFTADRGGLLACGDLAASQRALARLVIGPELFDRLNVDEFIKQSYDGDVATRASELLSSHPLLAKRMVALADFAQSPLATRVMGLKTNAKGA